MNSSEKLSYSTYISLVLDILFYGISIQILH